MLTRSLADLAGHVAGSGLPRKLAAVSGAGRALWVMSLTPPSSRVESIRRWWNTTGKVRFPDATTLTVTADAGGSNGYRVRAWKFHLAALAAETGLAITVVHYPPGTSKWNKIEHRLFSFISMNWRGRPLTAIRTIIELIGATTTQTGLTVQASYDPNWYSTGVNITTAQLDALPSTPLDPLNETTAATLTRRQQPHKRLFIPCSRNTLHDQQVDRSDVQPTEPQPRRRRQRPPPPGQAAPQESPPPNPLDRLPLRPIPASRRAVTFPGRRWCGGGWPRPALERRSPGRPKGCAPDGQRVTGRAA